MNTSGHLTPGKRPLLILNNCVEQTLILNANRKKLKHCLYWGAINMCLLGVVLYDIMHTCPIHVIWAILYTEYVLVFIFAFNIVHHFIRYISISLNTTPVVVTPTQKQLLGFKDHDPNYTLSSTPPSSVLASYENTPNASFENTPMNTSALSWRSNMTSFNDSQNYVYSSPSFSCVRNIPMSPQHSPHGRRPSPNVSPINLPRSDISGGELISDEQSLAEYLKGYQLYENTANISSPVEQPPSLLSSFWSHPTAKNNAEAPSFLRRCQYQLSPLSTGSSSSSSGGKSDEKGSPANSQPQGMETWRRLRVDNITLTQWNANIRLVRAAYFAMEISSSPIGQDCVDNPDSLECNQF